MQAADHFDRLVQGGRDLNDTEFVAMARQRFKADLDRDMLVAQDSHFLVIGEMLTWAVSLDGRSVKFVRAHSPNDLDVIELLQANWGRLPTYLTDPELIGSWIEGTVADSAGAGRFYLETDQYPSGRVMLCLRGQDPVPARGSHVEAWIFQQTPDSLLASVNEFGRLPISEIMRARYAEALTVFDELAGGATPNATDRLSELKGMANRCLRRDQGDWFSVWDVLGWPTRARLNSLATLAARTRVAIVEEDAAGLRQALADVEALGWQSDLSQSLTRLLSGALPVTATEDPLLEDAVLEAPTAAEDEYHAMLKAAVAEDRGDNVHERVRNELMVRLFRAGAAPIDSAIADIMRTSGSGTILYEVVGEGGNSYDGMRNGAMRLKEVAFCLDAPADHLVLVLPQEPTEAWAAERISKMFDVSIIWRSEADWGGQDIAVALAEGR
jgi:hypothetical protein